MKDEGKLPVHNFFHHHITWTVKAVYMCGQLLNSSIEGPDFRLGNVLFPWLLKLGQTKKTKKGGIVLFLQRVGEPLDVVVNFRLSIREDLTRTRQFVRQQMPFSEENGCWESPVLCAIKSFKDKSENNCDHDWEIQIQLVWQEIAKCIPETYSSQAEIEFERLKKVGTDLKNFFQSYTLSDIYLRIEDECFPAHKAILAARNTYLSEVIPKHRDGREIAISTFPTRDSDVNKVLLNYMYSGDVEDLMKNGALPIQLHLLASQLNFGHLEWFTWPYFFTGKFSVDLIIISHLYCVNPFAVLKKLEESKTGSVTVQSALGDFEIDVFYQEISMTLSPPALSVHYTFKSSKIGKPVYAVIHLCVKDSKGKLIKEAKTSGNMNLGATLRFKNFLTINKILLKQHPGLTDLHFSCELRYSRHEDTTVLESMPMKYSCYSKIPEENPLKKYRVDDRTFGLINMADDLRGLLMNGNYSDCNIIVGENKLPAHRVILAARSRYFSGLFDNQDKEEVRETGRCPHLSDENVIAIPTSPPPMDIFIEKDINIDKYLMEIILEEIYTGSASISDEMKGSPSLCHLAKFFGLDELKKWCLKNTESNDTETIR